MHICREPLCMLKSLWDQSRDPSAARKTTNQLATVMHIISTNKRTEKTKCLYRITAQRQRERTEQNIVTPVTPDMESFLVTTVPLKHILGKQVALEAFLYQHYLWGMYSFHSNAWAKSVIALLFSEMVQGNKTRAQLKCK